MESEFLFVLFLIAPWALALVAVLFYRRRRKRKTANERREDGAGNAG